MIKPDGTKVFGPAFMGFWMDDVHPAAFDVGHRLAMMDEMGIHAQIVYPNVVGFGGQNFTDKIDPELRLLCATIFNDAMAEIQEESGQRMFPMALVPWWDIDATVAEIARARSMGLRGINTNSDPHNQGYPDLADRALGPDVGGVRRPEDAGELPHRRERDVAQLVRHRRRGRRWMPSASSRSARRWS